MRTDSRTPRRVLVALPAVAVLLAPALVGTRGTAPGLFWGAVALLAFFGLWWAVHAAWRRGRHGGPVVE